MEGLTGVWKKLIYQPKLNGKRTKCSTDNFENARDSSLLQNKIIPCASESTYKVLVGASHFDTFLSLVFIIYITQQSTAGKGTP